jgi:hypothetical protein
MASSKSSGSHYGSLNFDQILPTRSRRHKELILQTYGKENGRGRAGDGGEDGLQRCSGFKGVHRSFLVLPSRFLSGQLLQTATKTRIWWLPRVR